MGNTVKKISPLALLLTTVIVQPVLANQPPGGQMMLAEILILPLMAVLTAIGGGYAVKKTLGIKPTRGKLVIVFLIFLFSAVHEFSSLLGTIAIGLWAITRAIRMIEWGVAKHGKPQRLISAGVVLILVTTFLSGVALAFVGYWPRTRYIEKDISRFVAYQLAYARKEKNKNGFMKFDTRPDAFHFSFIRRSEGTKIDFSSDASTFTMLVPPAGKIPFFPYNHFTAFPTFRADESGQIRMIMTQDKNAICPPDAPVVSKVEESEIKNQEEYIERFGGK
jgi:hypothetical protein